MRAAVLGAGGFIGSRLAARLAAQGRLCHQPLHELVLFDRHASPLPATAACPVTRLAGDLRDEAVLDALFERPLDAVFHLAATLTLDAESDFDRGLQTNVLALIRLFERCRKQGTKPLVLFASSISTFGGRLPETVGDDVFQAPGTSYGAHKVIAEHLLADYSRHGFLDGRALRLPIVLTHPGPASGSISDGVASLIREPLRGQPTVCRLLPDQPIVVASVDKVVASFLHLAALEAAQIAAARTLNLPGLTVTPAEIVHAVSRRLPQGSDERVSWQPDPAVQRIVDSWPRRFTSRRALELGFQADLSIDGVIEAFRASEAASP